MMKRFFISLVLGCCLIPVRAGYTWEVCQQKARENYPLIRQYELVEKLSEFNVQNASRAYLPQISLSGQATYQSEVMSFPEQMETQYRLMGLDMEGLRNDQYKMVLDVSQTIWDGGYTKSQKDAAKSEQRVSSASTDVELYALRSRVNQIYFGILMLDENLKLNTLVANTLQSNYDFLEAGLKNGLALESDLYKMKAEIISNNQTKSKIETTRDAYIKVLSLMLGEQIPPKAVFEKPSIDMLALQNENNRPELTLFDAQESALGAKEEMVNAAIMPRFKLFAQGLYGYPSLNMFDDMMDYKWSTDYIVGIGFQWNLSSLYTRKNNLNTIKTNSQQIDIQRNRFLYNNRLEQIQKDAEIDQISSVMKDDDEMIRLRSYVRETSQAKYQNGTITLNELLSDITSESKALLDKSVHEIEYLQKMYERKHITNN